MTTLRLTDCIAPLSATLVGDDCPLGHVGIDTRTLSTGDVYVALRGDQHDTAVVTFVV